MKTETVLLNFIFGSPTESIGFQARKMDVDFQPRGKVGRFL